jgi:transposase
LRYELTERRKARVNIDYHVEFDSRHYSVPYALVHEVVEVRATAAIVEIFLHYDPTRRRQQGAHGYGNGDRVATHRRSDGRRGAPVTDPAHRPINHRDQVWPPERLVSWGAKFGTAVAQVIEQMLARYVNPEQGYRACLGLLRAAERHGGQRMNAACERALSARIPGGPSRKYIEAILKKGLDTQVSTAPATRPPILHENVRGGDYYAREEELH